MYFHRRQTCTKRLSKHKFVTCNLKLELKLLSTIHYPNQHKSTHAKIKKQTLALSVILDEFEINRLGKLMFRTVVNSFFLERLTDGLTGIASDDRMTYSLGLIIDSNLNWKAHLSAIGTKIQG